MGKALAGPPMHRRTWNSPALRSRVIFHSALRARSTQLEGPRAAPTLAGRKAGRALPCTCAASAAGCAAAAFHCQMPAAFHSRRQAASQAAASATTGASSSLKCRQFSNTSSMSSSTSAGIRYLPAARSAEMVSRSRGSSITLWYLHQGGEGACRGVREECSSTKRRAGRQAGEGA